MLLEITHFSAWRRYIDVLFFNECFQWFEILPLRFGNCWPTGKGKDKVHPRTGHEGPEGEQNCSSTLPLTSALDGVGGQRHAPGALPPVKTRYPLYSRLGGPQGRSGRARKISPPAGIRSPDRPVRSEWPRVPNRNFRDFIFFNVDIKRRKFPSFSCNSVANGIDSDIDIFNRSSV